MNKIYFLILAVFLFASCDDSTSNGESVNLQFTQFDVTLSSGEKVIGVIDNDSMHISLVGVTEPLNIVSVDYTYSEGVSGLTPKPETRIGKWKMKETFRLHSGSDYQDYTVEIPADGLPDHIEFIQFDITLSSGKNVIGLIDNDSMRISLPGVKNPSDIVSVDYVYSDEVTGVTPEPEMVIGTWRETEMFRLEFRSGYQDYTVELPDYEKPIYISQATIAPLETFGTKIQYHILDLNGDANKAKDESIASVAFGDKGMNGIRFPLYCGDYYGGHPEPGVVIGSVYDKPMESLENAKKYYSGSEPFMIFLGIKCMTSDKNEYYPDWVSQEDDYIIPGMYAQMILDFIVFMDSRGHEVNAVAIDKESVRMDVEDFKESVDSIRAMTARLGYTVPKIVAPELLDPQGDKSGGWMNELYDKGYQDRFDVFGNHYYQRDHTVAGFAKLKYEFDLAQSDKVRPAWATEPHWNGDGELFGAESALGCMFDHTDLGLDAFMWWGYPILGSGSAKSCVMRAFSDAIHRSIPIRMLDHDGEETLTQGKLHTRAYLRGDEVNVFLLNIVNPNAEGVVPVSYEDYAIGILDGYQIDGKVTFRQWREDTDNDTYDEETETDEGELFKITPVEENQFLVDLPSGSVTQLTFTIAQ